MPPSQRYRRSLDSVLVLLMVFLAIGCSIMAIKPLLAQISLAEGTYSLKTRPHLPGLSSYVAPAGFPSSIFSSYYPTPSDQEPQPKVYDPVLNITFPLNLTDPDHLPDHDPDPIYLPEPIANLSSADQRTVIINVLAEIGGIFNSSVEPDICKKCKSALTAAKSAAQLAPSMVPDAMVELCTSTTLKSAEVCRLNYGADTFGAVWTQVLAFADVSGLDGQYICNTVSADFCPYPAISPLNTTGLFPKPRPVNPSIPAASGKRVKVLHISDFHLDPRYKVGSEGNCSHSLCCRSNALSADTLSEGISYPAPLYGTYTCDSPYYLALAALQAIGPLTGTSHDDPLAWTIYTGDLVSHDPYVELSRLYAEYAEDSIYHMFKKFITGPVFPALGNHDTNPESIDAPHVMPGNLSMQMSWNYNHVAGLWQHEEWINATAANQARIHYGAYSLLNHYGLRMITFNTDFWYRSNYLNLINTSDPDVSGTFQFMIKELQAAEDARERVWIFGHVLSGWDGSNPLANPTNLFYQIVDRYSPHVIANIFFGHTHEDQVMIYYSNNGTLQSLDTAINTGWIGPSVTPLRNLNSGFRMYEVDTGTFDIYEAYTWYADVDSFSDLDNSSHGPTYNFEYSTREVYGPAVGWLDNSPLNASFWHAVTEAMREDSSLVDKFNTYQGKSSVRSPNCTNIACASAKICYMRSGSTALGKACLQGYGSVQSAFDPPT